MLSHKYLPNYTVEDYNRWEGNWELIDGIPYAMSPSLVRKHQELLMSLALQIANSLKDSNDECGACKVVSDLDWILSDKTVLRPDIVVTCDRTGDFMTSVPLLIIEILSPSTALRDRHQKFEIYEREGAKYYIIADPNARTYSVYELINGRYMERKDKLSFVIHDKCSIELNIDEALASLKTGINRI